MYILFLIRHNISEICILHAWKTGRFTPRLDVPKLYFRSSINVEKREKESVVLSVLPVLSLHFRMTSLLDHDFPLLHTLNRKG
jgi:hypothetical protein